MLGSGDESTNTCGTILSLIEGLNLRNSMTVSERKSTKGGHIKLRRPNALILLLYLEIRLNDSVRRDGQE
jgi:hypothetical protein